MQVRTRLHYRESEKKGEEDDSEIYRTELDERLTLLEQMTMQNDFSAPLATDDEAITLIVDDLDYAILADWKYKEE